jgi:peptide/nickel transport system substrate-binding protein
VKDIEKVLRGDSEGIGRRDFMTLAGALGVGTALGTTLLGGPARAATPKKGGHLIIGLDGAGAGDSIDPATYTATYMQAAGLQFYNTLTEVDEKGKVQPSLAESWEAKPGATEWVVKLRKGVQFHNGKEMKPADVIYSINHHRKEDSQSAAKALLATVSDIKATGDNEITITLSSGNADLPYLLSDYHLGVAPEGAPFDGLGTGAFILENFEPGVRTLAKRNPNYWNSANRGHVDSTEVLAINDPTARASGLQSGSLHLINRADPKIVAVLQKNPNVQILEISGAGHYCFPMRCDTAPFDNKDLRLALKYAIDRDEIVKKVLRGHGKIGNDHPIPSFDPFYSADIPQRPYDPEKAKFHMQKSGFSGTIPLSVSDGAFTGAVDAAQIYQANAAKAGMKLEVVREPADGYWKNVWMQKPFCASYWGGRPTADLQLSIAYVSDAPWNESFWKRPDFDKLVVAARAELDQAKRKQMYHDLQMMVVDDGGEIIPMFNNFIDAASKKVQGFIPAPTLELSGLRAAEKVWLEG